MGGVADSTESAPDRGCEEVRGAITARAATIRVRAATAEYSHCAGGSAAAIVAGIVVVLLLLPFYDYKPERHPLRRPVASACAGVAVVAVLGLTFLGMRAPVPAGRAEAPKVGGAVSAGASQFRAQRCAGCHVIAGVGTNFGPELTHVGGRLSREQMKAIITGGKGAMPAFPGLTSTDLTTLLDYLQSLK